MNGKREKGVLLAVNGTLMRGLELEQNLLDVGATFVREDKTEKTYRLWSVEDRHPAMIRTHSQHPNCNTVDVEIWEVPAAGFAQVLQKEPQGLSIGKVTLENGEQVLGVIGEPLLVEGMKEISQYGGWRNYLIAKKLEG